ncbi:hypothetical protein F2Q69_00005708 [Brassica cretica]|uniref:Uncharacterized protein n=1 Tax=Brassica cretica TaxID=69181 RepID=A0A8S9NSR6_BRACR|nr:hypothetical protein F2Q69_00005708 [Brassica cretica]
MQTEVLPELRPSIAIGVAQASRVSGSCLKVPGSCPRVWVPAPGSGSCLQLSASRPSDLSCLRISGNLHLQVSKPKEGGGHPALELANSTAAKASTSTIPLTGSGHGLQLISRVLPCSLKHIDTSCSLQHIDKSTNLFRPCAL